MEVMMYEWTLYASSMLHSMKIWQPDYISVKNGINLRGYIVQFIDRENVNRLDA